MNKYLLELHNKYNQEYNELLALHKEKHKEYIEITRSFINRNDRIRRLEDSMDELRNELCVERESDEE